jgi:hydroxypyruvate reductase
MRALQFFPTEPAGSLARMPESQPVIERILAAALQAVDPAQAVQRSLTRRGDSLFAGGRDYDLTRFRKVRIVAVGKASAPMALAAAELLEPFFSDGIIITKQGYLMDQQSLDKFECLHASHPIPDEHSVHSARQIASRLAVSEADDLIVVLISGGGSALMVSPASGIGLADIQALTSALLASGADIQEINTLRKHLDLIKGGGLARLAAPATLITLILSDVIGDPLDVIASGPTVPDPTTFEQAYQILERYKLLEQTPAAVTRRLQRGRDGSIAETPKPNEPIFDRVQNIIIGSNILAAQAAQQQAKQEGFNSLLLTTYLQGEARQAGRFLGAILRQIDATGQPLPRPACLIIGGETTVTLESRPADKMDSPASGGRNQELALAAVNEIMGISQVALVTLATDGGDGPTDAAGALVTGESMSRARQLGLNPHDYLNRHDSYHFFSAMDDLLMTGPTHTNVNDLAFLFAFPDS